MELPVLHTKFNFRLKFIILLIITGTIPMAMVALITFEASKKIEERLLSRFEEQAQNIGDKIDRHLFERYADAQAFAINQAIFDRPMWYRPGDPKNDIIAAMNKYTDAYEVYYLVLLVDTAGKLIAVNSKDQDGRPVVSEPLYQKNFAGTEWFTALSRGQFTTSMPFSAPGNGTATGTYVEDVHIDPDVRVVYPSDDGMTLGFSAPVYEDGKVVAYWSNRTRFSLVEKIIRTAYHEFKNDIPGSEFTLLDRSGNILVDYDPGRTGSEEFEHDFNTLFKLNLADHGVEAAGLAVKGLTGGSWSTHARKHLVQATGYAHLVGTPGFPGMNWSVLVRAPRTEAVQAAGIDSIRRQVLIVVLAALFLIPLGGFFASKWCLRAMTNLAGIFQVGVREVSEQVNTSAAGLMSTSNSLAAAASEAKLQGQTVASAAEQASSNVHTVASASVEMSASIKEITGRVNEAMLVSREANQQSDEVVRLMEELGTSSQQIGEVIKVITSIAEQTNLLALNATIEAARAGDAGKGFAVVANEVKQLASQTANATDEIGRKIKDVQGNTQSVVTAIKKVSGIVGRINELSTAVAAAMEEQSAAVSEIARNVSEAAKGTGLVAKNIAGVYETAKNSGELAAGVRIDSDKLVDQSRRLKESVDSFIEQLRTF